jgi:uncharacterized phiE125 gp8 family phage protein
MSYTISDKSGFTEVLTRDLAKLQVKNIPDDIENDILDVYIKSARIEIEQLSERVLVEKTVKVQFDEFTHRMKLPVPTESGNIESLDYEDSEGQSQSIALDDIYLANVPQPNYIEPKTDSWPSDGKRIVITYTATVDEMAKDGLMSAVLLLIGYYYQNRSVHSVPQNHMDKVKALVKPHRRYTAL